MKIKTISENDPAVLAARAAEGHVMDYYGLSGKESMVSVGEGEGEKKLRCLEFGSGPEILCIPGNTGEWYMMAPLLSQLKHCRLIVMERFGAGFSDCVDYRLQDCKSLFLESVAAVLSHYGLKDANILAHSIGAQMAIWFAGQNQEDVRTLFILGSPGNYEGASPPACVRLAALPVLGPVVIGLAASASKKRSLGYLRALGHSQSTIDALPASLREARHAFSRLPNARGSAYSFFSAMRTQNTALTANDFGAALNSVSIIAGSRDTFGSMRSLKRVEEMFPSCSLTEIKGAGHLPWLESAQGVADIIKRELR